ncbi:V-set and transmembrane domain-containing protein 1 isoform X1 [Cricetulus griseus]|uniref:V-set and transmembrane domain-containing protein 1 isoform X1 n=1 Tax=Cricetulus griseus TaxID=10029 RepID=UPI0015C39ECE|nr:V-set and transmembrane domain-containing protein 1 isoform X1 [Cricetulus griseus]
MALAVGGVSLVSGPNRKDLEHQWGREYIGVEQGLCLCYGDEEDDEELPRPSISAWPSSEVKPKSNVTLQCRTHFQNVTVTLGKLHNSGYQRELRSAGKEAEFHLTNLQPEDAGGYFCAYRTAASPRWSAKSQHLQLVVTAVSARALRMAS